MRSRVSKLRASNEVSSDADLIACIAGGDQVCLARLYDRYSGAAMGLARRICGSKTIAEEVVQEAFMSIWQRPGSFDARRGTAQAFLLGIVHHKAVDAVRREASRTRHEEQLFTGAEGLSENDVVEEAWLAMRRERVRTALKQLSEVQREALELAYLHGLTYSEVAARLNIPLGTAKTRMRDGMIKLRALLRSDQP